MNTNKISFKEKISYGFGAIGKDMCYAIVSSYLMIYCTDVLGMAAGFVGTFMFAAKFWDAINDLFMGVLIDNTRSRWGKFRPWLFIGTLINAVVLIALFRDWGLNGLKLSTSIVILYVFWGMTYTIMDIPYWAMLSNFDTSKEERERIAIIPRIFASFGWLIIGTFGYTIINFFSNGQLDATTGEPNRAYGFFCFAVITAIIFVTTILITCFNVKSADGKAAPPGEKTTFKKMFEIITKNDQLVIAILTILTFNFATQIMGSIATYYFTYVAGDENLYGTFTFFSSASEMLGLFLFPLFGKKLKLSRKQCYLLASTIPALGFIILFIAGFVAPQNAALVAISGALIKFGSGLQLGVVTIVLADVVDYGEYKFDSRNEGVTFALQTLLVKFTSAFSSLISGGLLEITGFVAGSKVQSAQTLNGMRIIMCVVPIVFMLISFIIYKVFYKLEGQFFENILNVLKLKREASKDSTPTTKA